MVEKVIWMPAAIFTYRQSIEYLIEEWSGKYANDFIVLADKKIEFICINPEMSRRSRKMKMIFSVKINKRIRLYYRYRPLKKQIDLLLFWNSWQNPAKLKY